MPDFGGQGAAMLLLSHGTLRLRCFVLSRRRPVEAVLETVISFIVVLSVQDGSRRSGCTYCYLGQRPALPLLTVILVTPWGVALIFSFFRLCSFLFCVPSQDMAFLYLEAVADAEAGCSIVLGKYWGCANCLAQVELGIDAIS